MTLVSHRARFIFLKTHKTASTSVEAALEPLCAPDDAATGVHYRAELVTEAGVIGARGDHSRHAVWKNHLSAKAVRKLTGRRVWRRYAKITTVRNPYSRMVSMFHSRRTDAERAAMAELRFDEVRTQFRDWLAERHPSNNLRKLTIGPRYVIDHVIYFERLADEFAELADALGLPPEPLPRFKTDRNPREEPWRDYYDDDARRLVEKGSAFEIAFFGYRFADGAQGGPNPPSFMRKAAALLLRDPRRATNAFRRPKKALSPLDGAGPPP